MSKKKEAILLAGGNGSRLAPFTYYTSKHLLPIDSVPMIFYPLKNLQLLGVEKTFIIINGRHSDQWNALLSQYDFGMEIVPVIQDEPLGIPAAIDLCEDFINGKDFIVALGDNLIIASNFMNRFGNLYNDGKESMIVGFKVNDPSAFGVANFDSAGQLLGVVEKPNDPPSNIAIVGLYKFPSSVFSEIKRLKASARGELEVVDLINFYISHDNCELLLATSPSDYWVDTGTNDALVRATSFVRVLNDNTSVELASFPLITK
jgi:glucose-1-phosphate thymidylyltransferase